MNTERIVTFIAGVALIVLVVVMGSVWLTQPDSTLPPALSMERPEDISSMTFSEVIAFSNKVTTKTNLQVAAALSDTIGKRVYWDGYVGDVDRCEPEGYERGCYVSLYLKPVVLKWSEYSSEYNLHSGEENSSAQAYFHSGHRNRLLRLQYGEKIRVGCHFKYILNGRTPILEECRLVGMSAIEEWREPTPEPIGPVEEVKVFLRELPVVGDVLSPIL